MSFYFIIFIGKIASCYKLEREYNNMTAEQSSLHL